MAVAFGEVVTLMSCRLSLNLAPMHLFLASLLASYTPAATRHPALTSDLVHVHACASGPSESWLRNSLDTTATV